MSGLEVLKAGIFTTIQDRGRFGYMNSGITQSGVMDEYSYNCLNELLQNKKDSNCLEIVFGNVEFKSSIKTFIASTGAKCELSINGKKKQNWKVYKIQVGDIISIGKILQGQRVYFGVKDGFVLKKELKSDSSTIKYNIGHEKLKNSDLLVCKEFDTIALKELKSRYIPEYKDELDLRVVIGYQIDSFPIKEQEKFFNLPFKITPSFDRMGCKLSGEKIKSKHEGIISEAISFGSIQIPKDGQVIILLKDRQTIGGYPKIGTVLPIDCYKLAQMKIGSTIRFKKIKLEDAIKKQLDFNKSFNEIK